MLAVGATCLCALQGCSNRGDAHQERDFYVGCWSVDPASAKESNRRWGLNIPTQDWDICLNKDGSYSFDGLPPGTWESDEKEARLHPNENDFLTKAYIFAQPGKQETSLHLKVESTDTLSIKRGNGLVKLFRKRR